MISAHSLGSSLSLAGTLFQLGVILGMEPPRRADRGSVPEDPVWIGQGGDTPWPDPWAPHLENLGEGRPVFLGRRCPGRQATGAPFLIEEHALPQGYNPHAFPESDVVACVWLDPSGVARKAQLVGSTGSAALDRRLLRTLFRQWRFVPADGEAARGWQRIRLNSARRVAPLPPPRPEWKSL